MINRNKNEFKEKVDLLLENIGKDYDSWTGIEPLREMDESTLKIKKESSKKFKEGLTLSHGRKYIKVMENNRDDLVVILAGYKDKMDKFFESNPGFRSRIAHHIEFPDYSSDELLEIAQNTLAEQNYKLTSKAIDALRTYINLRKEQAHFANARSIRNALDRARLRHANRIFKEASGVLTADQLSTIDDVDILASRVFEGGIDIS